MKKQLLPLALFALMVTACGKESELAQPTAEANLHRSFIYERNGPQEPAHMATYFKDDVSTHASITEDGLRLTLSVPFETGKDGLSFVIKPDQLQPNYVGVYTFNPSQPDILKAADFRYTYKREETAATSTSAIIDNSMVHVNPFNHFTISAYNEKEQLISGDFELRMLDAIDPSLAQANVPKPRTCDILLRGSFRNVSLRR